MNQLMPLSITVLMMLGLTSGHPVLQAEFHPPDNGGPETTQGSGTRWSAENSAMVDVIHST